MNLRRFASVTFICVLSLTMVTGCSRSRERALRKQQSVLKVQITGQPVSLDPTLAEDGLSFVLLSNLMDGLVGFDGAGKLKNLLAESFTVSNDGMHYQFTLRPNATWSDGILVTPRDFVIAFRRALKPDSGSKLAELLLPIRGARAFRSGSSTDLPGVYEKDGKLNIDLETPASYFLQVLALPVALPLRQDILIENGGNWPWKVPSTGPYQIAADQPDKRVLLEKNDGYWGGKPSIQLIDFLIVQDESTGVNLFDTGQIDILTRIPPQDLAHLRQKNVVQQSPFLAVYYLAFNTKKAPFNDRDARRALAGSIHREELASVLASGDVPARSWLPRGLEGHIPYSDPAPVFADSVRAAKKKLSGQTVLTTFDGGNRNSMILEKVQGDVMHSLGLKLELTSMDWKAFMGSIHTDPSPIFRMGWLSPILDPVVLLEVFTTGNPNNTTGWSNAEYDRLVREIAQIKPSKEREAKIVKAQKILVDEQAVIVPLYHYVQNHAVSSRVRNFRANPFGVFRINELSLQ